MTDTIKTVTNCPTCGSEVTVGGEGETHFYVPKQKGVDVKKAFETIYGSNHWLKYISPNFRKGWEKGYDQAIQSQAGYSLEDMREAYLNNGPPNEEGFDDFVQSLTKEQPKTQKT